MSTFLAMYVMHVIYISQDDSDRFRVLFHDRSALPVYNNINREGQKCQNIPRCQATLP